MDDILLGKSQASSSVVLPMNIFKEFLDHREQADWVKERCQDLLLQIVEDNLQTCGLTSDDEHQRCDANIRNSRGEPLMLATVKYLDEDATQEQYLWAILKNGGDPNLVGDSGRSPLMHAVLVDKLKNVKLLAMHNRTNFGLKDFNGDTVLTLAIKSNKIHAAKALVNAATKRGAYSLFVIKDQEGTSPETLALEIGERGLAAKLSSSRVKMLKSIMKDFRRNSNEKRSAGLRDTWPEVVHGIIAAHRWRRFAAISRSRKRSNSAVGYDCLQVTNWLDSPSTSSNNSRKFRQRSASHCVYFPPSIGENSPAKTAADEDEPPSNSKLLNYSTNCGGISGQSGTPNRPERTESEDRLRVANLVRSLNGLQVDSAKKLLLKPIRKLSRVNRLTKGKSHEA